MTSELNNPFPTSNNQHNLQKIQEEASFALIGLPNINDALVILNKYYSKNNPILDINEPLPKCGSFTPLCTSAWQGVTKIVEFLLANGANPNHTIDEMVIPLHLAVSKGHEAVTYYLLKFGADINQTSKTGQTALMRACETTGVEVIKILLHDSWNIAPDILKKSNDNKTCSEYALEKDNKEAARLIEFKRLQRIVPQKGAETVKRTKI